MGTSTRIFIDFWNFQLNWNQRMAEKRCDWTTLPNILLDQSRELLAKVGLTDSLDLEETLVYASVNRVTESNLRRWLENFLDHQPSYRVKVRERRPRPVRLHCRECGQETTACPECQKPPDRVVEAWDSQPFAFE